MAAYARQRARDRGAGRGPRADRRRRQALPRRDLVAVGHDARPPGARARRGARSSSRPGRALDACSATETAAVIELAEALAEVVPVDDPHFLFASDGAAAVEQALKIAFQYWVNNGVAGRVRYLAFGGRLPRRHDRLAVGGRRRLRHRPLRPAALPGRAGPGYDDPAGADAAAELVAAHAARAGGGGRRAARPGRRRDAARDSRGDSRPLAEACREHGVLLDLRRGRDRLRAHRHAVRQRAVRRCGPTCCASARGITGGYLPHVGRPSRAAASSTRSSARTVGPRTLYHGHSYGGNALAAAVALRHLALLDERDVLANVRARAAQLAAPARPTGSRRSPGCGDVRLHGLMCGVELAPPRRGARRATRVCAAAVARGVLLRPLGDVVIIDAAAHDNRRRRSSASSTRCVRRSSRRRERRANEAHCCSRFPGTDGTALADRALAGEAAGRDEALAVLRSPDAELLDAARGRLPRPPPLLRRTS